MSKIFLLTFLLLFSACQEKAKPVIKKHSTLQTPIGCMKLNRLLGDEPLTEYLATLYAFDDTCPLVLNLSYKKDIVCNSSYNAMNKNMGKFPKSFVKLELRQGMTLAYSYYVDLYSNVDEEDVEEGFKQLKKDLIEDKKESK